jgi:hypothetical protein
VVCNNTLSVEIEFSKHDISELGMFPSWGVKGCSNQDELFLTDQLNRNFSPLDRIEETEVISEKTVF